MIAVIVFLTMMFVAAGLGVVLPLCYLEGGRCCFYEDGAHRCWKPAKRYVVRTTHIDDYCTRHAAMRLA